MAKLLIKNCLVLTHFFEEQKYSVMRLKEAVSSITKNKLLHKDFDPTTWNASETVKAAWAGKMYPAKFLQFGSKCKINIA